MKRPTRKATTMSKKCYSCPEMILNIGEASMFMNGTKQHYQCEDCMNGSNTFTCGSCYDGLATEQVDYKPSGYREWWCSSCTEDHEFVSLNSKNEWIFKEEKKCV
jgi:hypothetical protein